MRNTICFFLLVKINSNILSFKIRKKFPDDSFKLVLIKNAISSVNIKTINKISANIE